MSTEVQNIIKESIEKNVNGTITKNTRITLSATIAICIFIGAQLFAFGSWKGSITRDMQVLNNTPKQIAELEKQMIQVTNTRFTSEDGKDVYKELKQLWQEIANIKTEIARIPQNAPPEWFEKRVDRMEVTQAEIKKLLEKHIVEHTH